MPGISFAAALAVQDALRPSPATIKWPNDVLIAGKKVCGILAEHRSGVTALGIGINVHHRSTDFPVELRTRAGSLESTTGLRFDRVDMLARVLNALDESVILLRTGGFDSLRRRWAETCGIVGKRIRRDGITGVVLEIDSEGALVLQTAAGTQRFLSGDVTLLDEDGD